MLVEAGRLTRCCVLLRGGYGEGMIQPDDPERALALVYAPQDRREALAVLWRLDERMGQVLAAAHEPMIRAIRLAWWREALEALDGGPPPDEPLLQDVVRHILPLGLSGADCAALEEGWAALGDLPPDLARHARTRGRPLFELSARLLGWPVDRAIGNAGEGWALIDRIAMGDGGEEAEALRGHALELLAPVRLPRPLAVLAALARRDARPGGLESRRQGSPRRLFRALAAGMLGR
ncbi:phytoene synthase [Sphingomonas laterariae]|uniref:Phytoene synthase n=2 Tax=Edaphosphingomonas laterariae TaxID=861865 RepID=A0A239HMQ5_9SPHN|nr:phytoene synthase [Sphingomonas laterariae]